MQYLKSINLEDVFNNQACSVMQTCLVTRMFKSLHTIFHSTTIAQLLTHLMTRKEHWSLTVYMLLLELITLNDWDKKLECLNLHFFVFVIGLKPLPILEIPCAY